MINLTRYDRDGVELVIDNTTGEAFATVRGYARMSGKAPSTISERCHSKGVQFDRVKEAEILTEGGLQGVRLIPADLVFEWLLKDYPALAFEMGKAGATVYLHTLAGFKVSSAAIVATPVRQLPPPNVQVTDLYVALKGFGIELDNPRYAQALKDLTLNILGVNPDQALAPSVWLGVAERAEQLGYPSHLVSAKRSQLGKYVKGSGLECRQGSRLVNGTQREVNVYQVSDSLDQTIRDYFKGATNRG